MYDEEELLPLSGLQHLAFCERQWALIHLEQQWAENRRTAEGRVLHTRVEEGGGESRGTVRVVRGLRIHTFRLGVVGKADVVEFHRVDEDGAEEPVAEAVQLPDAPGRWRPFPVEYKRGQPKAEPWDEVQLCAQAIALEEMLAVTVPQGALFYGRPRRRRDVAFSPELRATTERLAGRMHELYTSRTVPAPVYGARCRQCSLYDLCQPRALDRPKSVSRYLAHMLSEADP